MNKDLLEAHWLQIRDVLKEKFQNLTDDDIAQINGEYERLVAKLQQKYRYSREEAEERIKNWNIDRFITVPRSSTRDADRSYAEDRSFQGRTRGEESKTSSFLSWLIPLICGLVGFGLGYLVNTPRASEKAITPFNQEQTFTETPADRTISSGIRNSLFVQQNMSAFQNVQITTRNGVVTLSGTVPNRETHDSLLNFVQNFAGVRQIVDNLQIR
jgi:uncharacterized protein YjbJ (UPF0337 family)